MSKSELFEKGLKVRKQVLGEDYVNKSIAGADELSLPDIAHPSRRH